MKVLLINNFHYRKGGSETVYFNTGRLLEKMGHEVLYFSFQDEKNEPCAQQEYFPVHSSGKVRQALDYFGNRNVAERLDALLYAEKPDIAHVHLIWGGISPSIFKVLEKHDVPLVHTVHDYRMVCPAYTFRNGLGEICEQCTRRHYFACTKFRCSKGSLAQSAMMTAEMYWRSWFHNPLKHIGGFLFVSKFAESKHIEHNPGFARAKRTVLYNSVSVPASEVSPKRGDYFLYYGRLSYEKGVEDLLMAFATKDAPALKVVGTGPMEKDLKALAAGYDNVEFLGYRSGQALFDLVKNSSYVIVPSRWYENNPMTIVEAYAYGKPVIGARIGGIPEILEGKGTGYIYESGDVGDLIRVTEEARNASDEQYAEMSKAARTFYEANFSEEEHSRRLVEFYNEVCQKSGR